MDDLIGEEQYLDRLRQLWHENWPDNVPRAAEYPFGEVLLTDYLRERARLTPDKACLIYHGVELSFSELDDASSRFAALLQSLGLEKGERVAVFLPNCPQFLIAFYGILKLGCVHVPVNPMFKEHELIYELNDAGARLILALDQLYPLVRSVLPQTGVEHVLVTSYRDYMERIDEPTFDPPAALLEPRASCDGATDLMLALAGMPPAPRADDVGLDDVAALNYTGGTTGMPKGCVHTQRDMIYTGATACTLSLQTRPGDVGLNFFPVFWIAGEDACVINPVFSGTTYVMLARWDAVAAMQAIQRYKVTMAMMLVDNAVELMEHPRVAEFDLRSLRSTMVASFVKKLNVGYRRRWEALTGCSMREAAWGMTETHTVDTYTLGMQEGDMDLNSQPVFCGLPMTGTEFKICSFETGTLMPLGKEGEIVVRTPSLLKAYWNKPEQTAEALRDGWLHTGDIGLLDEQGYLHFLGRRKEMLKVKGMSVFPAEIEALLGQHPAVAGSGVVGRDDEERGQVPVAFIRLAPEQQGSLTEAQLVQWCRENMAGYKVPEVRFVSELPMTATGKVKKEELSRMYLN